MFAPEPASWREQIDFLKLIKNIMKNSKTYESIMQVLRDIKPTPHNSVKLTDHIMEQINKTEVRKARGFKITSNSGQWVIFIGLRNAMTAAAIILIGVFIYQQWIITSKVSNLERELQQSKTMSVANENSENTKVKYLEAGLFQRLKEEAKHIKQPIDLDSIRKDQNLMNAVIRAYFQLKEENNTLRNKIQETYSNPAELKKVKQSKL